MGPQSISMVPQQISYVSIWSKELHANRSVFANVLGLPIAYEDENVVVFQTEGAQFVLQRAAGPDEDLDGTVQFGFTVNDLDAVTEALTGHKLDVTTNREDIGQNQRVTVLKLPSGQKVEFVGE